MSVLREAEAVSAVSDQVQSMELPGLSCLESCWSCLELHSRLEPGSVLKQVIIVSLIKIRWLDIPQ